MQHPARQRRTRPFAALLACLLTACASSTPRPDARELTVLSYNIKRGLGNDGVTDIARAAEVIRRCDPDFVALQEIDVGVARSGRVDQMQALAELTGMHARFAAFMPYQDGEYGIGVLSRAPILETHRHDLPPGPEPRVALGVRVALEDGTEVVFCSVHFYATEEERLAQARAVVEAYADEARPMILAGDFNSQPDDPVMRLVRAHWTEAPKGDDRFTFSATDPTEEIDYVLARPAARFPDAHSRVLDEPVVSDHRPVLAVLRLAPPPR